MFKHFADLVEQHGIEIWQSEDWSVLLPEALFSHYENRLDDLEKDRSILDVWFDSGDSHAYTLRTDQGLQYPADLYLEGSDQARGWFQSSLLTAMAATDKPPYQQVLTHGFVVDALGQKMSKSLGNTVEPQKLID